MNEMKDETLHTLAYKLLEALKKTTYLKQNYVAEIYTTEDGIEPLIHVDREYIKVKGVKIN